MRWVMAALALPLLATSPAKAVTPQPYFSPILQRLSMTCHYRGQTWHVPVLSEPENIGYSRTLAAAREPSLFVASTIEQPKSALRFTWLRSFDPPVVIRVEWNGLTGQLFAKQLLGVGGYEPGEVNRSFRRRLGPWETFRLRYMLWRADLFRAPPKDCAPGLDGAAWIFEGVDNNGYHFLERWSPESGSAHQVGLFLVGLTGWTFKHVY